VRSSFWTVIGGLVTRFLGVIGTLVLTRFVAPYDYGEVSAATVLAMTANQFSSLGVGTYVITHPHAGRDVMFHATVVHVGLGLLAFAAVILLGSELTPLVGAPTAVRYLPGMVLAVTVERMSFVPERVLVRRMEFGTLTIIRGGGEVAYTVVSLVLAALGWGGFAIVAGNLARAVLRFVSLGLRVSWRDWVQPARLDPKILRDIGVFGSWVFVGALAGFAIRRWDNLAVSFLFGPAVLGAYNLAYNLADIPAVQVGEQFSDVLQAAFARRGAADRKAAMLRSIPLLALIMVPLAVGLGMVGPVLARLFFDARWASVGPMLLVLAVISFPRPITHVVMGYLQVKLQPRLAALLDVVTLAILMAALFTVGRLGPLWACAAVGLTFIIRLPITAWVLRSVDNIPMRAFLLPIIPPAACALPLIGAVLATRAALAAAGVTNLIVQLACEIVAGAVGYVVAALVIARPVVSDLLGLLRGAFLKRPPPLPAGAGPATEAVNKDMKP
jgi:PST family polysaccharide transporter